MAVIQPAAKILNAGSLLLDLAADHAEWSQATFGSDDERGPIGALKHLAKEAGEAEVAVAACLRCDGKELAGRVRTVCEELADCLLLLLDASRRAGLTPIDLIRSAQAKMMVNKARVWPKTTGDVPTEHVREG